MQQFKSLFNLNPFTHLAVSYQEILFFRARSATGSGCWRSARRPSLLFLAGYWLFDRLRDSFAEACMTSAVNAIELTNVSKIYRRYGGTAVRDAEERAAAAQHPARSAAERDVSRADRRVVQRAAKGSTYGVIGRNGSGKSTALKLVAGITKPTQRHGARVDGRISALIELGAGFHPEISGRENVFINGIMLGLTKREIQDRFDEIVDFAELREFIDAPVKTYSSGMYMRLGFAVAIHVDPDVLLVDEVLAVGDEGFTHKCLDKFAEFRRRGKTILLVTHSLGLVERFCDEALWLDAGRKKRAGRSQARRRRLPDGGRGGRGAAAGGDDGHAPSRAAQPSISQRRRQPTPADPTSDMFQATEGRWGSREVEITDVAFLDRDGQPSLRVPLRRSDVGTRLKVRATHPIDDFVFGIGLFNADGVCCYGTNTYLEEMTPERLTGDAEVDVRDREPRSRRGHLQARRRRAQARRLSRTTTTACSTRSA